MDYFIDPRYRINIFLDTNILADYILQTDDSSNLKRSLRWLAHCDFVNLMSSHFVEYELTEVLKTQYFFSKLNGRFATKKEKGAFKRDWTLNNTSYLVYKNEIKSQVQRGISKVQEDLDFDFNKLELHKGIIDPTCDICLSSRVSKEDCLVLVSSMFPDGGNDAIDFSGLLSNDSDYSSFYEECKDDIKSIFNNYELKIPVFLPAKTLVSDNGKQINLYGKALDDEEIYQFWENLVLGLIKEKNADSFLGVTYNENLSNGTAGKCLYIDVAAEKNSFEGHDAIAFVANDLTFQRTLLPPEGKYWCMDKPIELPYNFEGEHKVSFLPRESDNLTTEMFDKLREAGNYVFYHNEK